MTNGNDPQPAGWYTDPTRRYQLRYWNGVQWTDNVATGATTALDAIPAEMAVTPPAPGTEATGHAHEEPAPAPVQTVQVSRGGSTGLGMAIGVLLALVAVVVVLILLLGGDDGEGENGGSTQPPTVETTQAPDEPDAETQAPEEAPTTTAAS